MTSIFTYQPKSLTAEQIESSPEIQLWLNQFPQSDQSIAKTMLRRLEFVSRDVFSEWFQSVVSTLPEKKSYALYSVRKLDNNKKLWNCNGQVVHRPGKSQGSEDFVYSLVSRVVRLHKQSLLDHPSLNDLRKYLVHDYILIDDSIGSGDRVTKFINAMLENRTFRSWWSFGLVKLHVLSFARQTRAETSVIVNVRGSDRQSLKHRKSSKIEFNSLKVYSTSWLKGRWGENHDHIKDLCVRQTKVSKPSRLGYGEVMANIVFHHSVPNNIPGIFWCRNARWKGLFPNRAFPDWVATLLEQTTGFPQTKKGIVSPDMEQILLLVKRGIRSFGTIAMRLEFDRGYTSELITSLEKLGLLSENTRLTPAGFDIIKKKDSKQTLPNWDRSLYTPSSWCTGQRTIQPSAEGCCISSVDRFCCGFGRNRWG